MPNPSWTQNTPGIEPLWTARVSAALPAAGAYDVAPLVIVCAGAEYVTLFTTYTQGAAGGAFTLVIEGSPYSADLGVGASWFQFSLESPGVLAAGADVASRFQRENITYQSLAAGGAQSAVFGPILLGGTIERLRVVAAESGITATPGILEIIAKFS